MPVDCAVQVTKVGGQSVVVLATPLAPLVALLMMVVFQVYDECAQLVVDVELEVDVIVVE